MRDVVLIGTARTPVGTLNGALSSVSAIELGTASLQASLDRAGIPPQEVEDVVFGTVLQAGLGQNPARQVAMRCGIPETIPAFTVNQVCGSGLKAIQLAYRTVACGDADVVAAGGTESMSRAPHLLPDLRRGVKLGGSDAVDALLCDGLTDAFSGQHMGRTAEAIAEAYSISRREQDQFALQSQQRAARALEDGVFADEIVPLTVRQRKKEVVVERDEHPRPGTTIGDLSKLKPAFRADGTVTPGNASGINDGAATMLVASADSEIARKAGAHAVRVRGTACVGCDPAMMGLGPVYAVRKLLDNAEVDADRIGLWELNEAFAAQSIAVMRDLGVDPSLVNVNGGAIALGHPIGASGARIVVSLVHEMRRRSVPLGVAALCVGGGMGLAILLEEVA